MTTTLEVYTVRGSEGKAKVDEYVSIADAIDWYLVGALLEAMKEGHSSRDIFEDFDQEE